MKRPSSMTLPTEANADRREPPTSRDASESDEERIAGQIEEILARLERNPEQSGKRELVFAASTLTQTLSHCLERAGSPSLDAGEVTQRIIDIEAARQTAGLLADRLALENRMFYRSKKHLSKERPDAVEPPVPEPSKVTQANDTPQEEPVTAAANITLLDALRMMEEALEVCRQHTKASLQDH